MQKRVLGAKNIAELVICESKNEPPQFPNTVNLYPYGFMIRSLYTVPLEQNNDPNHIKEFIEIGKNLCIALNAGSTLFVKDFIENYKKNFTRARLLMRSEETNVNTAIIDGFIKNCTLRNQDVIS